MTTEQPAGIPDEIAAVLPEWVARQRWYAGKGRVPRLGRVGGFVLPTPTGSGRLEVVFAADRGVDPAVVYQIPLSFRDEPLPGREPALIATTSSPGGEAGYVYDAPHDPDFARALLSRMATAPAAPAVVTATRVLLGEQSNTSIVCERLTTEGAATQPAIVKVFRILQEGVNPDVEVQAALSAAGSAHVPRAIGAIEGSWVSPAAPAPAPASPDPRWATQRTPADAPFAHGHLAVAQEFLPQVTDGWQVALAAARQDTSFDEEARRLGETTASIHVELVAAFGSTPATQADRTAILEALRRRAEEASDVADGIEEHLGTVHALLDEVADAAWPPLQRIHGDYHLGQVLATGRGTWVAVDFEGEPLRPLAERTRPDLAVRDVAGMLRSFDYAGGSHEVDTPGDSRREWVAQCRAAFLDGYRSVPGHQPLDERLLRVLELDKALYEVVYEARNRPSWLNIPLDAVGRLLGDLVPAHRTRPN